MHHLHYLHNMRIVTFVTDESADCHFYCICIRLMIYAYCDDIHKGF